MAAVLYLASANPNKAAELGAMAAERGYAIEVRPAAQIGGMPPVVEDTGTFEGNARKKALALAPSLPPGSWALADDSGICVDALGGLPGVDSAYYAGPQADSAANLAKLARAMRGVPLGKRGARFVCVLALVRGDGTTEVFEGRVEGNLALEPAGEGGFGYDPLFIPLGGTLSMAQIPAAEKNRISHRGLAFAACARWLAKKGGESWKMGKP
jgi:XTP/dITP diphosphohydrolase